MVFLFFSSTNFFGKWAKADPLLSIGVERRGDLTSLEADTGREPRFEAAAASCRPDCKKFLHSEGILGQVESRQSWRANWETRRAISCEGEGISRCCAERK